MTVTGEVKARMLVCAQCFGDTVLQKRVDQLVLDYEEGKCDRHTDVAAVDVEHVAQIFDDVIRSNYTWGHYDNRTDDFFGEEVRTIVSNLAAAEDDDVIEALVNELMASDDYWPGDGGDPFYHEDATLVRNPGGFESHSRLWDQFRESIAHGQRFFNDQARELLGRLFQDLHLQRDQAMTKPIYLVNPGDARSKFSRVRIANDAKERETFRKDMPKHLGPPPARKRRPGRMNPSGVVAFYGGFDIDTCIAELRPPVGSTVVSAEFEILKPMVVLDTTAFASPPREPNVFSDHHSERMAQWRFMQRFMHEIAQPISPDDEHLDYIPTQAVAEYLLNHHVFELEGQQVKIEAILYRSAQNSEGINIAVLGEAGVVRNSETDAKTERKAWASGPFEDTISSLPRHPFATEPGRLAVVPGSYREFSVESARFAKIPFYAGFEDDDDR